MKICMFYDDNHSSKNIMMSTYDVYCTHNVVSHQANYVTLQLFQVQNVFILAEHVH